MRDTRQLKLAFNRVLSSSMTTTPSRCAAASRTASYADLRSAALRPGFVKRVLLPHCLRCPPDKRASTVTTTAGRPLLSAAELAGANFTGRVQELVLWGANDANWNRMHNRLHKFLHWRKFGGESPEATYQLSALFYGRAALNCLWKNRVRESKSL